MKADLKHLEELLGITYWKNKSASDIISYLHQTRDSYRAGILKDPLAYYNYLDLKPGMRVLDAGCGIGFNAEMLARTGLSPPLVIHACDSNPELIDYCNGVFMINTFGFFNDNYLRIAPIAYRVADLTDLPYPNEYFDRILMSFVLQHIDRTRIGAVFRELNRVVKQDGLVAIIDTDWSNVTGIGEEIDNIEELEDFLHNNIPSWDIASFNEISDYFKEYEFELVSQSATQQIIDKYSVYIYKYIIRKQKHD